MANIRLVYDVDEDSADYHSHRLAIEGRKEILAYQKEIRLIAAHLLPQTLPEGADKADYQVAIPVALEAAQDLYLKSLSLSPPEK